jgi:Pyridoxamine 5'-phosphate oxidase
VARWSAIEAEAPELAATARERFEAGIHKTIATLRADGSPRISGIEANFVAGDLWFGSMPDARKADDLIRDPRFALHSASGDPPDWSGDAKLAGRAIEIPEGPEFDAYLKARAGDGEEPQSTGSFHLFRAEIAEVTLIGLNEERTLLVIEHWSEGGGVRRIERE